MQTSHPVWGLFICPCEANRERKSPSVIYRQQVFVEIGTKCTQIRAGRPIFAGESCRIYVVILVLAKPATGSEYQCEKPAFGRELEVPPTRCCAMKMVIRPATGCLPNCILGGHREATRRPYCWLFCCLSSIIFI